MILPMFGLLMFLIVVGALATLVAVGDPNARVAPSLGFIFLFAGLGALLFSIGLALLGQVFLRSEALSTVGFFGGYALGGLAGAVHGFNRAIRRRVRIDSEARE